MKLIICICTYNRNDSLLRCLKSINHLYKVKNIKIEVIVVDNSTQYTSFKLVKKIKKSFRYQLIQLHEKRRGIVYARNRFLKEVKKINPKFISFFDDDCIIDPFWLTSVFKVKKYTNAEILTGPQMPLRQDTSSKSNLINYSQFFERKYKKGINSVNWAASNNVFLKYEIIKRHNLLFDKTLNKFGIGEDQLFFSKLNNYGYKICWSKTIKVFETIHKHRQNLSWLISRSFRLGVLGHYIDIKIHGKSRGLMLNYLKCIYYFTKSISLFFLLFSNRFQIKTLNYFSRFYGRLIGPFVLKKIGFFKK